MMTIHDFPRGPYPARVRIAVAELGLRHDVRFVEVDLRNGEHKTAAFREKNFSGTVPVLELEDGTFIAECTAITEYLDHLGPAPRLTGATARDRGLIHMMSRRAEIECLDAISVYFHHATSGLGPGVETYQNREWGLHMRDKALRGARYFDDLLKTRPYVAGDTFSMADITLVAAFVFAGIVGLDIPPELERLHAWHARMLDRPGVRGWRTMSDPVAGTA